MCQLTFNGKRIGLGILLLLALFSLANMVLDLGILGSFDKLVFAIVIALMFVYLQLVGPSISEVRQFREKKAQQKNRS